MENKKVKLPKTLVERFMMKPSLNLYYGRTVTKDLEFDEWTEDKTTHQTLKKLKLVTTIKKSYGKKDGIPTKEDSRIEVKLKPGMVLIWTPEAGYILPQPEFGTMEEIVQDINELKKAIYNE